MLVRYNAIERTYGSLLASPNAVATIHSRANYNRSKNRTWIQKRLSGKTGNTGRPEGRPLTINVTTIGSDRLEDEQRLGWFFFLLIFLVGRPFAMWIRIDSSERWFYREDTLRRARRRRWSSPRVEGESISMCTFKRRGSRRPDRYPPIIATSQLQLNPRQPAEHHKHHIVKVLNRYLCSLPLPLSDYMFYRCWSTFNGL